MRIPLLVSLAAVALACASTSAKQSAGALPEPTGGAPGAPSALYRETSADLVLRGGEVFVSAGNVVSALAFDSTGRLWAGSFREGVDVFAPDGARIAHVESDELRETNALAPDGAGGVLASTSQGLFHIAASLRVARLDGSERQSGGAVTQVAQLTEQSARGASSTSGAPSRREKQSPTDQAKQQTDDQLAVATPKGLSLVAQGHARVLTTVQGLPSNSVYSVLPFDGRVYAGAAGAIELALEYVRSYVSRIAGGDFAPSAPQGGCAPYCPAKLFCWRYTPAWGA